MTIRDEQGRFVKGSGKMSVCFNEAYERAKKFKEERTMTTEAITEDRTESKYTFVTKQQFDQLKATGVPLDNFKVHDPMEENRKKKMEKLEDKAATFVDDVISFHSLFEPLDIMFKLKAMAKQAIYWHYRSRRAAEQMQARLDAQGSQESPMDTRPTGLEIDPVGDSWERIENAFRRADAEHVMYLTCIQAQNALYRQNKGDANLADRMREAAIDESISEAGYSRFCNQQDQQWLQRRKEQQQQSADATRMDYATRSFI